MPKMRKTYAEKKQEHADAYAQFDPNGSLHTMWGLSTDYELFIARVKRGPLMTKFDNAFEAKLWELTPSGWMLRCEKLGFDDPRRPKNCERCGVPTVEHRYVWDYQTATYYFDASTPVQDYGKYKFVRKNGKILSPPTVLFLCQTCQAR